MSNNQYGAIPDPTMTTESLWQAVVALKQAVEILTRQRRPVNAGAVTWLDLVELGLIKPNQVPPR